MFEYDMYVIPAALQNGTAAFEAICFFLSSFFFLSCSLFVGCPQPAKENDDDGDEG